MKVLFVSTISNTVNTFLIPHIRWLIEQGNTVGAAFNKVQEISPELKKLGCKVHLVNFQRNPLKKDNITAYKSIKKCIVDEGYEFVHVHTPVASFLTRFACRNIKNVKVLYTAHGFHFFKGAPKKNWAIYYTLEKIAARWTDGIVTMNEEDYEAARKFKLRNDNAIYKIPGIGLKINKFVQQTNEKKVQLREKYGYKNEDFILIFVGELSYRKHQDLLIEAVSMLKGEIPSIKLLLVGTGGRLPKYKEMVNKLDVVENVEFLGYRKDIPHLMVISDVAISSSRQEGLPVNVMEAMATGLPLIVTNCRGNRDLVYDGDNGFLVDINDVKGCCRKILNLYRANDLREKFAKRNRELIKEYALENVLNEMKEIYTSQF